MIDRAGHGGLSSGGIDLEATLCLTMHVHTPHVHTLRGVLKTYILPSTSGHGGRAQSKKSINHHQCTLASTTKE